MGKINYELQGEGERIEISIKRSKKRWMISNHPELIRSLMNHHTCFDFRCDNKRNDARIEIYWPGKGRIAYPYLSKFAFYHYYKDIETCDIFDESIWNREYYGPEKTIDHLDGDPKNNCKENLYEMTRSENSRKKDKTLKFRGVFSLAIANDGREVRLQMTYTKNGLLYAVRYRCANVESLCDCIDYLLAEKWKIRERTEGRVINVVSVEWPFDWYYEDFVTDAPWFRWNRETVRPLDKYDLARKLTKMPKEDFILFDRRMMK